MMRVLRFSLLGLLVLFILLGGAAIWALNDEAFLRSQLESRASKVLGRDLSVGRLDLELGKTTRIRLHGVHLANADWGQARDLVSIGILDARIDLSGLFEHGPVIEQIAIDDALLNLEEDAAGRVNWTFDSGASDGDSASPGLPVPWKYLRLSRFELTHQAPEREVPLDFRIHDLSAEHQPGGRVEVAGTGKIGGYALVAGGYVEPLAALFSGGHFTHRLTVELGDIRLVSEGVLEDVHTGAGANLDARFSGPDFAWLLRQAALPEFSSGPFDVQLDLDVNENRSVAIELEGDFGSVEAHASGIADRLVNPARLDLSLSVSGPDLATLGETLGIAGLPALPYRSEGALRYGDTGLEVESMEVAVGPDRLLLSGKVGPWPGLEGTALDLSARGPDVSVWGPSLGFQIWRPNPFTLAGRFVERDGQVAIESAVLSLGESELRASGRLGAMPDFIGADLEVNLSLPDASRLTRLEALDLPAVPLRVSGSLKRDRAGVHLSRLGIALLENTAELSGLIALKAAAVPGGYFEWPGALSGSRITATLAVPDARSLGALLGRPELPPLPGGLKLTAGLDDGVLGLDVSDGRLGDASFAFDVELGLDGGMKLRSAAVSASGPEFRHFFDSDVLAGLPGQFRLEGRVVPGADAHRIEAISLKLGDIEFDAQGQVASLLEPRSGNLSIRLNVPEVKLLQPFVTNHGVRTLPGGGLSVSANVGGNRALISLTEIAVSFGESDLRGYLAVSPGDVPEMVGSFESDTVDLSWLADQAEQSPEPKQQASVPPSSQPVFSDAPLPVLTLDPIYADLGLKAKTLRLSLAEFRDVDLGLAMTEEAISLAPLEFSGQMGERLSGKVYLEIRKGAPRAEIEANARGFRFGVGLAEGQDISSAPPVDLIVDLEAVGTSMHELAGSADGEIVLISGKGQLANHRLDLLFSDVLLELFQALNPFGKTSRQTNIDCGVARLTFAQGSASVDPLIVQTDKIIVTSSGEVNLHSEKIDLSFSTRPRTGIGISPGAVLNPFTRLGGTLAHPSIVLNPTGAAVSGGAAAATGGLSLLGKSLYDRFLREHDPCGKLVEELRKMHEEGAAEP